MHTIELVGMNQSSCYHYCCVTATLFDGGGDGVGVGGDNNKLLGIISLLKWFAVYELDTICKHTNACKSLINNNDCAKKHLVSFVYHL